MWILNFGLALAALLLFCLDFRSSYHFSLRASQGLPINQPYRYLASYGWVSFLFAMAIYPSAKDSIELFTLFYPSFDSNNYLINVLSGNESIWSELRRTPAEEMLAWPFVWALSAHVVGRAGGLIAAKLRAQSRKY